MDTEAAKIKLTYKIEEISKRTAIEATRNAYKKTGKDPAFSYENKHIIRVF